MAWFDPREFLRLAQALCDAVPEDGTKLTEEQHAQCRTATGRAYYSVFLVAREYFKNRGEYTERSQVEGSHEQVVNLVKLSKQPQMAAVLKDLQRLKEDRVQADYFPKLTVHASTAKQACFLAQKIITTIDGLS